MEIGLINKFNEEVTSWMQLNIEVFTPEYDAIRRSYLEAMEDETEARMEYEGNKVSTELKKKLKDASDLRKKPRRNTMQCRRKS